MVLQMAQQGPDGWKRPHTLRQCIRKLYFKLQWLAIAFVIGIIISSSNIYFRFDVSPLLLPVDAKRYNDPVPYYTEPVLEILHPPMGFLLADTDLQIEIAIRGGYLKPRIQNPRVCIAMQPTYIPPDVQLETGTSELPEVCFEQNVNYTTFYLSGLVPGLSYSISVGLVNRGHVVGISMRTFKVASIQLPGWSLRMSVADALDTGAQFHHANDRNVAAQIYRFILEQFPDHLTALHLLGLVIYQEGDPQEAYYYIQRAAQGNASDENFQNSMGLCLKAMGRTNEAINHFRRAIELRPSCTQAALNLGDALQSQGKWQEAMHEYKKVVAIANDLPSDPTRAQEQERFVKDATGRMCELVRFTDGWYEAERCLTDAIKKWPHESSFHNDRGNLLLFAGQFETALHEYERASNLGSLTATISVADTLETLGDTEESIEYYNRIMNEDALSQPYSLTRVLVMKATVLPRILPATQEEINAIRDRFEREVDALQINIDRLEMGKIDPSRIGFSTCITMNTHNRNNRVLKAKVANLYNNLLYTHQIIREDYVASYAIIPPPYRQIIGLPVEHPPSGPQRLRVGFLSRFMFNPAVGFYMAELIPQLDRTKYEIFVFGIGLSKSMKTVHRVEQIAEHIVGLPRDLRVARVEVKAAKLDLLIYPELGMDKTTYLLSFTRLAPVQAVWWGNSDTSGVPTIDYYLASEYEHESYSEHYTEEVYQFKGMGIYHQLPELPVQNITRAQIRRAMEERFNIPSDFRFYFCIESLLHIHPDFDESITRILQKDDKAHIFLLSVSNRQKWKVKFIARLATRLGEEKTAKRVFFFNDVDDKQEAMLMHAADAVLSSLHLTRARSAMEAFTIGVPVVTWPGYFWASRITYGFYQQMGIDDLIATSMDEYVDLAIRLATDTKFHAQVEKKIQRGRDRLSQDRDAVLEWERFFDFAGSKIYPSGEDDKNFDDVV